MSIINKKTLQFLMDKGKEDIEKDGKIMPMLFVHESKPREGEDKPRSYVIAFVDFDEKRYETMAGMGMKLAQDGVRIDHIMFISDAWMVKADSKVKSLDVPPSKHPDRQEILIVNYWDIKNNMAMLSQPYTRKDDKIIWDEQIYVKVNKDNREKLDMSLLRAFWKGYAIHILAKMENPLGKW